MKNVKIKYSQLIFLYAYLRLIDLSLDRSRWEEWDSFLIYFKNMLSPDNIIKYIRKSFDLTEKDLSQVAILFENKTTSNKIKAIFYNRLFLRKDEILYCCKLLLDFEIMLKSDIEEYNSEVEQLRINIARYYSVILGNMITNRDLKRLMKIEHFNKSDKYDIVELIEFIPNDFQINSYG